MGSKGTRYSSEFKEQIVELRKMGKSVKELCDEYGLGKNTVREWIKEKEPVLNYEGKEISKKEYFEMKKKVRELELENEILKKATAIFTKKV
jgi:transposase